MMLIMTEITIQGYWLMDTSLVSELKIIIHSLFLSVVFSFLYLLVISMKWKHGIQILEIHIFSLRHLIKFISQQGMSFLVIDRILSFKTKRYIFFALLVFYGMKGSLVVSDIWYSVLTS